MLSIVYSNDNSYIRFVYIDNDGTKVQNGPDIWYHTAHGLNHAAIHLLECISLLSKQPQSDKRPESLFLLKALLQISCDILKNDSPEVLSKAQRTYMQVKHHLAANLNRKINRNIVAKELQLNPSYVSRLFKKNHGDTFNHYLTELRMEQAAQLLEDKAVTIDEAAWQCGYGDTGYFIKLFKYYFGITPGQYCLKNKKYFEK
jgi:AraC-like DNA-binding protein